MDSQSSIPIVTDHALTPGEEDVAIRFPAIKPTGELFYLSRREKLVVEAYISTGGSIRECRRQLMEKYPGRPYTLDAIRKWVEKPHVKGYLLQRIGDLAIYADMTKERYFRWVADNARQDKAVRTTTYRFMVLLGKVRGWLDEGGGGVSNNIQLNITQANGKA